MRNALVGIVFSSILFLGCAVDYGEEEVFYVYQRGSYMPVWLRGNVDSGKALLILHGGPGNDVLQFSRTAAFDDLENDYAVFYWSQRNSGSTHGDSPPSDFTLDQCVRDADAVVDVLRDLHPEKEIFLLGHSWGGSLATAYLVDPSRQAKIRAWICVDGCHNNADKNVYSRQWVIDYAQERLLESISEEDRAYWTGALSWYGENPEITKGNEERHYEYAAKANYAVFNQEAADDELAAEAFFDRLFFSPSSFLSSLANNANSGNAGLRILESIDLDAGMGAISIPTRFIWGEHDGVIPPQMAHDAYDLIATPEAEKDIVLLHESAHSPMAEEPLEFAAAVREFVDRY